MICKDRLPKHLAKIVKRSPGRGTGMVYKLMQWMISGTVILNRSAVCRAPFLAMMGGGGRGSNGSYLTVGSFWFEGLELVVLGKA